MTLAAIAIVAVAFIVSSGGEDGPVAGPATSPSTPLSQQTYVTTSGGAQETTTTSEAGVVATTSTTTTAVPTTTADTGFSEEFQGEFMDTYANGGNRAFCRCALDGFEAIYTEAELTAILDGTTAMPRDFSDPSIACLDDLPFPAPLPAFVLPNTCTIEEWDVVVSYPSNWSVVESFGPCGAYTPDDDPSNTPILFLVDATTTLEELSAVKGEPEDTFVYSDRTYTVWVEEVAGTWWIDFFAPLWIDVPDGPVIWFTTDTSGVEEYATVALTMVKGLQVAPYSS